MLRRAMVIYRLSLLSFIHRLRHDFARELVIGFCGFILLSLFYYIFNDFLNEEVKNISGPMRQFFAEILAYVLTGIGMVAVIRMIRNELSDPRSHGRSFAQLGESRSVIFLYLCLRIPSLILMIFVPLILIRRNIVVAWDLGWELIVCLSSLVLIIGLSFLSPGGRQENPDASRGSNLLSKTASSPFKALVSWKLAGLLWRHHSCRICLAMGAVTSSLLLLISKFNHPAAFLVAFMTGIFVSCALILQISSDLECSWFEKNLGVSHDLWMASVTAISLLFSFFAAFLVGSFYGGAIFVYGYGVEELSGGGVSTIMQIETLIRLAMCGFTPPFLVPFLALQIDGRRSFIQMMSVILCSLFVATAIYASLASLALLPLIFYYGVTTQKGRFYRA